MAQKIHGSNDKTRIFRHILWVSLLKPEQRFLVQILSPFEIKVSNPEYFSGIIDNNQKTNTTDTSSYKSIFHKLVMYQFLNFFLYSSIPYSTMRSFLSGYLSLLQVDNTLYVSRMTTFGRISIYFMKLLSPTTKNSTH